jgi:DNA invertase Pin-like site-specific DNA recombinase
MIDVTKVKSTHTRRDAIVYIRQSHPSQVENNRESTARQYALVEKAMALGWAKNQVITIDEDLGVSGKVFVKRSGFDHLNAEVALGRVGILLGLEVSRLARSNADWYRLLDMCAITDTLLADSDGVYHPALFNDRLVLGLKGTMSEAELHILRERLDGGIRNKAARGELRRALPVGFMWGDLDGEVHFHPDEAVTGAIRTIFNKFTELGSARQVWLWFRSENLSFPVHPPGTVQSMGDCHPIRWVVPTYAAIHRVLSNPVYAGAYAYGKTRYERYVDEQGTVRKRFRNLPLEEWSVLLPEHHQGFIDWAAFEAIQTRLAANIPAALHQAGRALREGSALLQGLIVCGHCGRRLRIAYQGTNNTPRYYCHGEQALEQRSVQCLNVGGLSIDQAVSNAFLEALKPAAVEATALAVQQLESQHDAALSQWRLEVERARYETERAERQYKAVDPENRLVARGLEKQWETRLQNLATAEAELLRREEQRPRTLTEEEYKRIEILGSDLRLVWTAPTTTDRDRKELLHTLLEEVILKVERKESHADITLRWRGGMITKLDVRLKRHQVQAPRTDEDTMSLLRRLAAHYPDDIIAGILNRQKRKTAYGEHFTASHVGNLRRYHEIPRFEPPSESPSGELLPILKAAKILGVAASTLHRWLNAGLVAGEQLTPGAPWRIRISDELRNLFVNEAPPDYVPVVDAMRRLGVSRQTVWQRVKRGELEALHVRQGQRKGLRIRVVDIPTGLFQQKS